MVSQGFQAELDKVVGKGFKVELDKGMVNGIQVTKDGNGFQVELKNLGFKISS